MKKPTADERELALAGLREFQQEAASLRQALRGYERALERVCRNVERDAPLHEVMNKIGVGDFRAGLVERLTRFEAARHRMRVVCFRLSLSEGLSIGGIARLWGISRQLASRLVNENDEGQPPHPNGHAGLGALPTSLRGLIASRAEPTGDAPRRGDKS